MTRFILVGTVLALALSTPARAWGPEGHQIVAAIAARHLTPAARKGVSALLDGEAGAAMMRDSSWADEIREDRPETASWHYVNIELGASGYDARRDCPHDDCVVAQIGREEGLLADPRAPRGARIEALRFLIHFVGDVHQPLHAADRHDKGANALTVFLHGRRTSLHRVWDQDVVTALGPDPLRVADDIDARVTSRQAAQWRGGTPADWANQSFAAAGTIYAALPGERLPGFYARAQGDLVRQQLAKAGLRLAAAINRIFR